MKIVKKYTAMQIGTQTINDTVKVNFEYGDIEGPYYDQTHPQEEFDTEEEAIKWAYEQNKWSRWMIVPIVKFDNYD
jgi:hypothetical protein